MTRIDSPLMAPIIDVRQETTKVKTFTFAHSLGSQPGQFVMLWIPGIDQKPFSISQDFEKTFELTIFSLGASTHALFDYRIGDRAGVTGPYGTSYTFEPNSHLITVAGGYGAAPLRYLADRALLQGCTVDFIVGARTADDLLFEELMTKENVRVHVSTDDGSKGHTGYSTQVLEQILEQRRQEGVLTNTKVFACGPELMQVQVAKISQQHGIPSEISLERYMKCGFGICGNCCVDTGGETTCQRGPVVSGEYALSVAEFGVYHRDKKGIQHSF